MKRINIKNLLCALILFPFLPAFAQAEVPDTVLHVVSDSKVVILENPAGTTVELFSPGEDGSLIASVYTEYSPQSTVKSSSREEKFQQWWQSRNLLDTGGGASPWGVSVDGVCIGLTKAVDQHPSSGLQWSKSFEICWMSCLNVYYKFSRSSISLGLGFDWRNYKITTSDKCLVATDNKGIGWGEYPAGTNGRFSRLKTFSLQLPLLYEYDVPKSSLTFKAGPVFNFNTYASLKTVWDDENGNRRELFTKSIDQKKFTVDFFASLSFCRTIGLYVRYSPMKVMDAQGSLNFRPLTVGIGLGI